MTLPYHYGGPLCITAKWSRSWQQRVRLGHSAVSVQCPVCPKADTAERRAHFVLCGTLSPGNACAQAASINSGSDGVIAEDIGAQPSEIWLSRAEATEAHGCWVGSVRPGDLFAFLRVPHCHSGEHGTGKLAVDREQEAASSVLV
jgi:hypothetical protein